MKFNVEIDLDWVEEDNTIDEEIKRMDSDALDFWNKYKTMLLVACDTHVHAKESEA